MDLSDSRILLYYTGALLLATLLLAGALYYAVRLRARPALQRDEPAHTWRPPDDVLRGVTDVITRIAGPDMVDDATLVALIHATGEVDSLSNQPLRQYLEEINQRCVDARALRSQYERLPAADPLREELITQERGLLTWICNQRVEVEQLYQSYRRARESRPGERGR